VAHVTEGDHFARLIEALDPWLGQVVIIGGWAHRLYRLHPMAQQLDYEPLGTLDTDVAVPSTLPATGEELRARLLAREFREELLGDMQPPAAHYRVQSGDESFYAEFLTPLQGSEINRGGRRDVTTRVSGVSAQKLRHLELLLQHPWEVLIAPHLGYPTSEGRRILVPNATAFLAQKILIHDRRNPDERAKDILYIHDTIETFGSDLAALRELWEGSLRPSLHSRAARRILHSHPCKTRLVIDYCCPCVQPRSIQRNQCTPVSKPAIGATLITVAIVDSHAKSRCYSMHSLRYLSRNLRFRLFAQR
jgi:hypothetical protein